jgi:hypothetical protein
MDLCCYYQARVTTKDSWFLVAVLRSFEHLAFDRTLDKQTSTFEFFVPSGNERTFTELLEYFKSQGVILDYQKLPNRLEDATASL